jgi:hypothetical protein
MQSLRRNLFLLRLRDQRQNNSDCPARRFYSAGSPLDLFIGRSVLRRFRLIAFQRNPTFFKRPPQHSI